MHRFYLIITLILTIGCAGTTKQVEEEIAGLEAKLAEEPNDEILGQLLGLYKEMASMTKGESHFDYLWKAGETARAAKEFDTAESIFMELYSQDENPDLATKALFLHAFMCDEDLKEYDKAKELYKRFLEKYPDSDFSDDAQFLLENIGKSDEEMLELLHKSNPGPTE